MNKRNYLSEFDKEINSIDKINKPKLLLHSCCAPCSSACLEVLLPYFSVTVFYYNPNITDGEEYYKRLAEQRKYCLTLNVPVISGDYEPKTFLSAVTGYENAPEGGARCPICYTLRLEETAKKAKELGFDYFCSTLSVSPYKNAAKLNEIGEDLAPRYGVKYLINDFKKRDGYKRSVILSEQNGLYRQNYCGCGFSKRDQ